MHELDRWKPVFCMSCKTLHIQLSSYINNRSEKLKLASSITADLISASCVVFKQVQAAKVLKGSYQIASSNCMCWNNSPLKALLIYGVVCVSKTMESWLSADASIPCERLLKRVKGKWCQTVLQPSEESGGQLLTQWLTLTPERWREGETETEEQRLQTENRYRQTNSFQGLVWQPLSFPLSAAMNHQKTSLFISGWV